MFQYQSQGPQDPQDLLAAPAPKVLLVSPGPEEGVVIQVILGLMVNQEFQELDFLGLLDLRETRVSQEQKEHRVVLEKWESLGYLDSQASQGPRENQE